MAQKVIVQLVDDLDGGDANETVRYALDGVSYEIDVSEKNAQRLRATMEEFTSKSRRAAGGRQTQARGARRGAVRSSEPGAVRVWARENGYTLSDRGRIPADVMEKYQAAQK
jgi:hypothetical protein